MKIKAGIGIKRDIDSLGRVCIPKEMRKLFGFEGEVEIVITELGVLIRRPEYKLVKIADTKSKSNK